MDSTRVILSLLVVLSFIASVFCRKPLTPNGQLSDPHIAEDNPQLFTPDCDSSGVKGDLLGSPSPVTADSSSCNSYCDEEGYFKNGFDCDRGSDKPLCCGDSHERFCCNNSSQDASELLPVYICDKSSWWIFHWQIAIGMVGVVILILILAACCCQCCVKKTHRRQRQMVSERRRHGRSRGRTIGDHIARQPSFFSPEHPFAFTPPEYDSLAKDPPSYAELSGHDNPGFLVPPNDPISGMSRSASLPSYTSQMDCRRISDTSLPPYSSRNVSRANTPNASRRSSIQSGIILNLSRRNSLHAAVVLAQPNLPPSKEKDEEQDGNDLEGQSADETQEFNEDSSAACQLSSASDTEANTVENVVIITDCSNDTAPLEQDNNCQQLEYQTQNTHSPSEQRLTANHQSAATPGTVPGNVTQKL